MELAGNGNGNGNNPDITACIGCFEKNLSSEILTQFKANLAAGERV